MDALLLSVRPERLDEYEIGRDIAEEIDGVLPWLDVIVSIFLKCRWG